MKYGAASNRWLSLALGFPLALGLLNTAVADAEDAKPRLELQRSSGCPVEMVELDRYCIDRWEVSLVDKASRRPLSPYYPPEPATLSRVYRLWQMERHLVGNEAARSQPLPELSTFQRTKNFAPVAVSRPNVVPQGYLSYYLARTACENASKRLCTEEEWVSACRGASQQKFPYGASYREGACNVFRNLHPAHVLHGHSFTGHTDPRLNLVVEFEQGPLLRLTGAMASCASHWRSGQVHDMVGNLDEWVEDETGTFLGGFYARGTKQGCDAKIASHSPLYLDYSIGTRCCRDSGS